MISGSSPLPKTTFLRWKDITGHNLLERYGMTEIGMALSNPLLQDKTRQRLPGFTGLPLPLVQARIVSYENSQEVLMETQGEFNEGLWSSCNISEISAVQQKIKIQNDVVGNLQIKSPTVFKEYFKNPAETKKSFTDDGFFITGDSVFFSFTKNSFKILGRNSVDIIKSKGYKISALEIETILLENPMVEDCAVIGVLDVLLGQKILALIVHRNNVATENQDKLINMNKWCQDKFASYSLPNIKIVDKIVRNQMGKVNKKELVKIYENDINATM